MLLDLGGQDITRPFEEIDHSSQAYEILKRLHVGTLQGAPIHVRLHFQVFKKAMTKSSTLKEKVFISMFASNLMVVCRCESLPGALQSV